MESDPSGTELPDLAGLIHRPAWMAVGSCRGSSMKVYFPERGASAERAREVCRSCPVQGECLSYAMADPDLAGVWEGLTARERVRMRQSVA